MDSGFVITTPLYQILKENRPLNDLLALVNSILLFIPLYYLLKVTFWDADYTLAFRMVSTSAGARAVATSCLTKDFVSGL